MTLSKIKSAGARINAGAWVRNIPVAGFDGVALKVRGVNTAAARVLRDQLVRDLPKGREAEPADLDRLNDRVITDVLLVDWTLTGDDGAALPCLPDKVSGLLADADIGPLLREAVSWAASVVGDRGEAELATSAKN